MLGFFSRRQISFECQVNSGQTSSGQANSALAGRRALSTPDIAGSKAPRGEANGAWAPKWRLGSAAAGYLRRSVLALVALTWTTAAMAHAGGNHLEVSCAAAAAFNGKICQDGGNCQSGGFPNNPTDIVHVTNVVAGTKIKFSFTEAVPLDTDSSTTVDIMGQESGNSFTQNNLNVEPSPPAVESNEYEVTPTDAGDTQSTFQITVDNAPGGSVAAVTYKIMCTPAVQTGKVRIEKQTIGGQGSFQFTHNFPSSSPNLSSPFTLNTTGQGDNLTETSLTTVPTGTYSVAETVVANDFTQSSAVCTSNQQGDTSTPSSISLQADETITCRFVNTKNAKLTLVKNVENNGGGTKGVADFPLFVNGTQVTSGVATTFPANVELTATETSLVGYTASSWGGSCSAGGKITLQPGDNKTCTITNTFKPDPKLKITKSSDKTSYKVGETITYSIVAENIGNVTLQNVKVTDDDVSNLSCLPSNPVASLAPGAKITCTASHVATADDAKYGSFTNEACVNDSAHDDNYSRLVVPGDYSDGGAAKVCDTETDEVVQPKGKLTIVKNTIGGEGTFKFNWYGPSSGYKSLTTANHVAQSYPIELVAGSYTIHESEIPDGWELISSECAIVDNDKSLVAEEDQVVDDGSEYFTIAAYKDTVCTFTNRKKYDEPMDDVTEVFINRRLDNLLTEGPDRARLLRRLSRGQQQSLKDGGPVAVTGSLKDDETDVKVAASLSGMVAYNEAVEADKIAGANGFHAAEDGASAPSYGNLMSLLRPTVDVWVEGHYKTYDDHTAGINRDGRFGILYVGADYAVSDNFLLGALVQFDDTRETLDDNLLFGGSVEGRGWMAGPYLGWILSEGLLLDARIAWGQSSNDIHIIDPIGGDRTGSFDTDRWLASVSLTGNWTDGLWRFSPEIALSYGEEDQDAYLNSLGQQIGAHKATIGRLTFGPEVGYTMTLDDGSKFEPHASIKGIWNFAASDLDITSVPTSGNESLEGFRARIEAGFLYTMPSGVGVRAAVNYDGIGDDDFKAWGGEAWVNIPLN